MLRGRPVSLLKLRSSSVRVCLMVGGWDGGPNWSATPDHHTGVVRGRPDEALACFLPTLAEERAGSSDRALDDRCSPTRPTQARRSGGSCSRDLQETGNKGRGRWPGPCQGWGEWGGMRCPCLEDRSSCPVCTESETSLSTSFITKMQGPLSLLQKQCKLSCKVLNSSLDQVMATIVWHHTVMAINMLVRTTSPATPAFTPGLKP